MFIKRLKEVLDAESWLWSRERYKLSIVIELKTIEAARK